MFSFEVSPNSKQFFIKHELPSAKLRLSIARLWRYVYYSRAIIPTLVTISVLYTAITIALTTLVYAIVAVANNVLTNATATHSAIT